MMSTTNVIMSVNAAFDPHCEFEIFKLTPLSISTGNGGLYLEECDDVTSG